MPSIIKYIGTIKQGLSLVVVEDGLVQCAEAYDKAVKDSLNPYCSGRWSRTKYDKKIYHKGNLS